MHLYRNEKNALDMISPDKKIMSVFVGFGETTFIFLILLV